METVRPLEESLLNPENINPGMLSQQHPKDICPEKATSSLAGILQPMVQGLPTSQDIQSLSAISTFISMPCGEWHPTQFTL